MRLTYILLIGLSLANGCSSVSQVNRSRLNHPAMDLQSSQTPDRTVSLTYLDQLEKGSGGAGCTVCAK